MAKMIGERTHRCVGRDKWCCRAYEVKDKTAKRVFARQVKRSEQRQWKKEAVA